ncbi:lytic murein transglycosylase [Corynebacterium ureicelerivorans]|uniref:lytic transglycosylase domain-containing protein n=1 Tax=Corynebacterium ureicelerivorans TaxID=401472 RepID=UPI002655F257|nr:lytic murein transglycosylase [Corynebacterium ureicelerivorans]MDN8605134.1 lytic murein transglycosylase [Corynebacterium ureicelerivorans]
MTAVRRVARGCGCAGLIAAAAAVVMVVALIAWLIAAFSSPEQQEPLQPVPSTMPPPAAEAPPAIDIHAPGRTSDLLFDWSQDIGNATDISGQAVRAYANAALIAAESWPACNLTWNTLAGIGWVETRHGTYTGRFHNSVLDLNGYPDPRIIGPRLDGDGFAQVGDTDGGTYDGDTEFDRAVGPMQFIPESWGRYGRDANGDGVADPQQIDDAALGAANLLCNSGGGSRDLATEEGWRQAIFAYNQSNDYVARVRDAAANYALNQPAHR